MKKSRYSETKIVRILKEVEGGRLVKEVSREYGISDATYYNWNSKYGGMEASDIKRLKELEDANVDQVILLNQAGKNTHQDICDSLELFAKEVMPEFKAREDQHQAWKQAVLNGEIELEDIDTEPFNISRGREPTQKSTREARDMVAGTSGRPDSQRVG